MLAKIRNTFRGASHQEGNLSKVETRIAKEENGNKNYKNEKPHHIYSAQQGHIGVVEELLEGGKVSAEFNGALGSSGKTLEDYSMEKFLKFIKAVRNGDFEKVKVLANEKNINNSSGDGGDTALHIATYAGYTQVVKNLLKIKGVKVDAVNKTGETPLHLASNLGDSQIVEVLLKNGKANPLLVDNDGKSALHFIAASRFISLKDAFDVINLLLQGGVNLHSFDNKGQTALQISTQNGNANVVKIIMKKTDEADENAKSEVRKILWKPEVVSNQEVLSKSCFLPISCVNLKELSLNEPKLARPIPRYPR
jgi:ankyrin repeat protein